MSNPRKEILANGETYHVYNKSVGGLDIFYTKRDLNRALDLIDFYRYLPNLKFSRFKRLSKELRKSFILELRNQNPLVELYSFSFMYNHYHLLLRQIQDRGISIFVSNFQNAFAKYFNKKNESSGSLFIRPFKGKRIVSEEILVHVSRYIHLNPVTSFLSNYESLHADSRTSFPYYHSEKDGNLVNTKPILNLMGSVEKYEEFIKNQVDYQRKLHILKKYLLE